MQTSFVSFPTDSGRYPGVWVDKGALIILCGLIMPVGHVSTRCFTRKSRVHEPPGPSREVVILMQPIPIRIWHWINVLSVVTLCLTAAQRRFPLVGTPYHGELSGKGRKTGGSISKEALSRTFQKKDA